MSVHSRLFNAYFELKFKKTPDTFLKVNTFLTFSLDLIKFTDEFLSLSFYFHNMYIFQFIPVSPVDEHIKIMLKFVAVC
jgi:hypothetical protein